MEPVLLVSIHSTSHRINTREQNRCHTPLISAFVMNKLLHVENNVVSKYSLIFRHAPCFLKLSSEKCVCMYVCIFVCLSATT